MTETPKDPTLQELTDQLVNGLPPLAKAAVGLSKLLMGMGPAVHEETHDGGLDDLADDYADPEEPKAVFVCDGCKRLWTAIGPHQGRLGGLRCSGDFMRPAEQWAGRG